MRHCHTGVWVLQRLTSLRSAVKLVCGLEGAMHLTGLQLLGLWHMDVRDLRALEAVTCLRELDLSGVPAGCGARI